MLVLGIGCSLLIAAIISVDVSTASSQKFNCSLPEVPRCVEKVDNLTECNCTGQNQTYCPHNKTCLTQDHYNETLCWKTISCVPAHTTSTTVHSSATVSIASTTSLLVVASTSVAPDTSHVSTTYAPTTYQPLETNYKPIIISLAVGFACFVVFVCCMCAIHSWWLKRNKFTGVNSTPMKDLERKKRKQEQREMKRRAKEAEAKELSKFDMGYKKPPKVNERALASYDWARTSYLPGMLEPSQEPVGPADFTPKLICDDEDTEAGDQHALGDHNQGYESEGENQYGSRDVSTPSSLFAPTTIEPQEPIMVEPEIIENKEQFPRSVSDGNMTGFNPQAHSNSQDYFKMMGRF